MAASFAKLFLRHFKRKEIFFCSYATVNNASKNISAGFCNNSLSELRDVSKHFEEKKESLLEPISEKEEVDVIRSLKPTFTFSAYVNKSKTLQNLVNLGVDLSKIEKKPAVAEFLLRLDFERNVMPYIHFLNDIGVDPDNLGQILSKNILILKESFDDLHTRINYLESKQFDKQMIATIITRNPYWLTTPVSVIDERLGWFQRNFDLSGNDVRQVVNSLPQIVTASLNNIKVNKFVLEEELGMPKHMVKGILKRRPRMFVRSQKKILDSFEYVHNVMNVPLDLIAHQPDILMNKVYKIKERHLFLKSLGRDQFNPNLPGYVPLDSLVKLDDAEFCLNIAKSSLLSYNEFLKTL